MASLGHIVVGMTAARVYRADRPARWPMAAAMAVWALLSLLPDADVIGFGLGVQYGDEWGHRGATHSIVFALVLAAALGASARFSRLPPARTGLLAAAVLVSHGLLDTLTDGGLGSALFWPFDLTRYFAPWQPIPVAPIGLDFLSPGGVLVTLVEAILFAPLLWWALRGARPPTAAFVAWCMAVFLITWRGEARDNVLGYVLREDVQFASNYSEDRFQSIAAGLSAADALARLGQPLREVWLYIPGGRDPRQIAASELSKMHGCLSIVILDGRVESTAPEWDCGERGIEAGVSRGEVQRELGPPPHACWEYTLSPNGTAYRGRIVCVVNGLVYTRIARWMPPRG